MNMEHAEICCLIEIRTWTIFHRKSSRIKFTIRKLPIWFYGFPHWIIIIFERSLWIIYQKKYYTKEGIWYSFYEFQSSPVIEIINSSFQSQIFSRRCSFCDLRAQNELSLIPLATKQPKNLWTLQKRKAATFKIAKILNGIILSDLV